MKFLEGIYCSIECMYSEFQEGPVQTSNFSCAEPTTSNLGQPKLLSSTVDSDGRNLDVPSLIRGEEKFHRYCFK